MKFGFVMPPLIPSQTVEYAVEAEQAGWDGIFLSEAMWSVDAWICLTGAAMRTSRIKLGTLLTPLSTMRPWKLAIEAATLDQLSGGRVIITVGMGAPDTGFAEWGEETDLRTRAELVDEGMDIIIQCWQGKPFSHRGKHYTIDLKNLPLAVPTPAQKPRIPIWAVGAWPRPKSLRRTLRVDGVVPYVKPKHENGRQPTPDDIRALREWLAENGKDRTFDVIVEGQTPGDDPARAREMIEECEDAGATWWIESWWGAEADRLRRLRQGPPEIR
jgi:alkanesulfonate monooxygenase SsuD/methylene tetrahydromethanopterin reductase-like flavin-dependent oxidoreductase (luciferase family)